MRRIAVHHGDLAGSVRAAMIFPDEQEKARILVGWHLAGGPLQEYAKSQSLERDQWSQITMDAHHFEGIRDEVEKREIAGQQAGAVILVLWSLVCNHPDVASLENAIQVIESLGNANGIKTHRNTYREQLQMLQPTVHLWAESYKRASLAAQRWPTSYEDIAVFVTHAEIIAGDLKNWNSTRPNPTKLLDDFIVPYLGWLPSDHPMEAIELPADLIPTRKKPGRPRNTSRR